MKEFGARTVHTLNQGIWSPSYDRVIDIMQDKTLTKSCIYTGTVAARSSCIGTGVDTDEKSYSPEPQICCSVEIGLSP